MPLSRKSANPSRAANAAPAQPIKLTVDATHAPEKILHAQLQIPVAAGEVKLVFPKWIPGEHGPTGPIADLTGLKFFANGQRLNWRRDLDEVYTFHVTVPAGVSTLGCEAGPGDARSAGGLLLGGFGHHAA